MQNLGNKQAVVRAGKDPMEEIRLPELWKDWKITECVGQGSFGTVYKAERPGKGEKA